MSQADSKSETSTTSDSRIEQAYRLASEAYAELGVDAAAVLEQLKSISISLHCWQGDDVGGFEGTGAELGSGLAVTGNYPGRAPYALRTSQRSRSRVFVDSRSPSIEFARQLRRIQWPHRSQ